MNLLKQEPRPHADDTRLIPLTQGQFAIVDARDYEWLKQWKWFAVWAESTKSFYAARHPTMVRGKRGPMIFMHRQILGLKQGDKRQGDHKESGSTLDNRRSNLRIATPSQNVHNSRTPSDNKSGYKGVSFNQQMNKWVAYITVRGQHFHLGYHTTIETARAAYRAAALEHLGEFARPD